MEILVAALIYMVCSLVISLGTEKARGVQKKTANKGNMAALEQNKTNVENGKKQGLFDEFPTLWEIFEVILKEEILKWIAERNADCPKAKGTRISILYRNIGFSYWFCRGGKGYPWKMQLDELFFESCYYKTKLLLDEYYELDALATPHVDKMKGQNAEEIYRAAVKPLLDIRKQKLMGAFEEMAKELNNPFPYALKVPVDGQETALTLAFQTRYKKKENWSPMDGYTYSHNGRTYHDIQEFRQPIIEELSANVGIAKDTFGDLVLRRYTEIPAFDSGDREWDSEKIEYLMCDGKDIHLIIMRGGYRIAHLIFFEKLLTADARMKPIFEKLGWPMDDIKWI